jgi:hypothetical protein
MQGIQIWAAPWWVNLLILVPVVTFLLLRQKGLLLNWRQLLFLAVFGLAFGFVEASVVVYLRAAIGLLPGSQGTLQDLQHASQNYQQSNSLKAIPEGLLSIEMCRETASAIMLLTLAWLCAPRAKERWAVFLWAFAVWDISYYLGLWLTVRWPASLKDVDILFLIPTPWIAQVWFPLLVSLLTLTAIAAVPKARG